MPKNVTKLPKINKKFALLPLSVAIATSLLLSTFSSHAAPSPDDREFDRRVYIGGSIGYAVNQPKTSNSGFHISDESATGGALYLGYDISKHWSAEVYAASMGSAEVTRNSTGAVQGDIDYANFGVSAIGYFYNAQNKKLYQKGYDDEGFYRREGLSAFGRIGLGRQDNTSNSVNFEQLEDTSLHLGAGVEYGWNNGIATRVEFISHDKDNKYFSVGLLKRFGETAIPVPPAQPAICQECAIPQTIEVEKIVEKVIEKVVNQYVAIPLPTVHFLFDHDDLTNVGKEVLNALSDTMQPHPDLRLNVNGHTDARGTDAYNDRLSERRVRTVVDYLTSKGVPEHRFETEAFGESDPLDNNNSHEGRANNRRVQFRIIQQP